MIANLRIGGGPKSKYLKGRAEGGDEKAKKDIALLDTPVNVIAWSAFSMLHKTRDVMPDGIVASLKISEMVATLTVMGVTDAGQRARMVDYMIAMDYKFREWVLDNGPNSA